MANTKHIEKKDINNTQACLPDSNKELHERAIRVIQENYAETQINLTELSYPEKKKIINNAQQMVEILADSLGAENLLQNMLVTQLLGIHELQQKLLPIANRSINYPEHNQYYINAITKLSNVFIQQVNTLQKLQGLNYQKVRVEHLHVHDGGQAMVGQVNTYIGGSNEN
ncbi:TPA: hypothetical protein ACT96X_003073 [Legionella pneumophila]|uniref:hypothetical protein n=1 Tax=Legionella pneumophila TaxID=446 RepID=UPI0007872FB1|nr:hypothetical protein [Legionella pneumophila]HAU1192562.1 hypothetical protein [Legionella pneumophila]HAU1639532.1 hypothetical protein [Legionella pneumophila]HBD7103139.1 hypothetical protein [Legionella pneumophila]HCO4739651.1 hypothetical protein [Legionella pneumophila]HDU7930505.1 hypothetical protein [Legionella pneumophila]